MEITRKKKGNGQQIIPTPTVVPLVIIVSAGAIPGHVIQGPGAADDVAAHPLRLPSAGPGLRDGPKVRVQVTAERMAYQTWDMDSVVAKARG